MRVAMAVWGIGLGMYVPLGVLAMAHYMGADKMAATFGVSAVAFAVSMVVFGPLLGKD